MARSRRAKAAGFTLLELLVALTLATLLFAAVGGALYQVGESLTRSEAVRERSERLALVESLLRRKIEGLQMLGTLAAGKPMLWFQGSATQLEWLTTMPEHPVRPGLHHLRVAIDGQRGLLTLLLAPWQEGAPPDWGSAETVTLLEGIQRGEWRYLAPHSQEWHAAWQGEDFHPWCVMLDLVLTDGKRVTWVFLLPHAR
jgi:general secretion pathway protein J